MSQKILTLFKARNGHFLLESGHHGNLWLDLELLCLDPQQLKPWISQLSQRLKQYEIQCVCGPLVEGAFAGLMVAYEMGVEFVDTQPVERPGLKGVVPIESELPK